MKKILVLLLLAALLVPALVFLGGCGPNAEQIAKDSMKASEKVTTAHFTVKSEQELPRAPVQGGKVAAKKFTSSSEGDINQKTGDWRIKEDLVKGVPITGLYVDEKLYIQLAGNWYEMPESFEVPATVSQALSTSQYLKYFKTLNKLGDTKVDGEKCYHLQGVPDMKELIKLPGITDLLKDPGTGKQVRTVDELADAKAVFDFYIRKSDNYIKRTQASIDMRVTQDFIKLGYGEPGDRVKFQQATTFSKYNEKLSLTAPPKVQPWPGP